MKRKVSCGSDFEASDVPLKHKLLLLFWILGPAFTRWAESQQKDESGLTPQRMRVAEHLFDRGPSRMCELRDALGVTATNVTALVDALEEDGYVERAAHPEDRRATLIKLTAKAHKTIEFGCTEFKDKASALFADFTAAEQETLFRLLKKMRDGLVAREVLEKPETADEARG